MNIVKSILITGGAGFIGSHLADELIGQGYRVKVLDNLSPQVHGGAGDRPAYLHPDVELVQGDVRDRRAVNKALKGVDAVYHFAAMVGVGQSMYAINDYVDVNNRGTAVLLEALVEKPVQRLIVASSMSIYGEGLYLDRDGRPAAARERTLEQLKAGEWEPRGDDGGSLEPAPTPETNVPALASVYALSKFDQEKICLITGQAYNIPTVALRFFNVYGTRQALSNPYTGVLAIFASRLLNDNPPLIYEDGNQQRDFVSVHDVAAACRLALEQPGAVNGVFNIGSGNKYTINEIAGKLAAILGKEHLQPEISHKYRVGDIRHCYADIGRARKVLGFKPSVSLSAGLEELAGWLEGQKADDKVKHARDELASRGLTV